ncbi:MAG: response regulator [Acidobacteria bacterium]|nr:MAG: response regulator [Acidobacteriota bacterium]
MRLALERGGPGALVAWPEGRAGRALAERVRQAGDAEELLPGRGPAVELPGGLVWIHPERPASAPDEVALTLVLGFRNAVPPEAERVLGAVQSSLSLALSRLLLQARREESRLRETVEGLPLGVALLTPDGRVRLVNQAGRRLLEEVGAWPGEGEPIERIGTADLGPLVDRAAGGSPASVEILLAKQGRTLELRVVPAGANVLAVFEDVTEDRRRRHQLAQAEKLSALGKLISGVVHEINNPLATVVGYAEMVAQEPDAPERMRWLGMLRDEAERCQRIVRNMLSLAGSRSGGRELVAPAAVAERALSLVSYPFRVAGVQAHLEAAPETPAVEADPDALLQMLINLLTNALHALEEHDGPREVRVRVRPDGEEVLMEVADTGPGIPPEHLDRIFDPFFTSKPEGKGTGLGLSLVAATARDHGGRVEVRSAPGKGAAFVIHLPAAAGREEPPAPEERPAAASLAGLEGRRVLVVDDEPAVAELLAEILERAGASATHVSSGEEALRRALEERPDAVIADLRMPGLSGEKLVHELGRRAPELVERVVLTTGDLLSADGARTIEAAGRPCLVKPFQVNHVVETVRGVIDAVEAGRRPGEC